MTGSPDLPIWTDEARHRLLGACDGYVHAIAAIRRSIGQITYRPINPHHARLMRERDNLVRPLKELDERLTKDLRECQEAYKRETARAALTEETGAERPGSEG